jgi:hypothetical protein
VSTTPSPHEELRALLQRYARAADARDVAALAELFADEATIEGARGLQSRAEWLESMARPPAFPSSMHLLGDPLIAVGPTGTEAALDTYAVVFQLSEPGSGDADLTLGIHYLDRAVLEEGRWVITHRESRTVWMR